MDTIVAIATAAGESAIGIVRLSGDRALDIAGAFLDAGKPLGEVAARRAFRACAFELASSGPGEPIDDVVVVLSRAPNSYTGEDMVEISAHGSPYILSRLVSAATSSGARWARPGEFTLRAFLNGKMDLAQAEGVAALIHARTRLAHRAAFHQLSGGLSEAVRALRQETLAALAFCEARIDHLEEDDVSALDPASGTAALQRLDGRLADLMARMRQGRLLQDGVRIAIVGPPNAGKSSLLNAFIGRERAIVLEQPGTTRDTLEESADLDGLPAVLIDTAGLREHALDPAERVGMERARTAARGADVLLCVVDHSRPLTVEDRRMIEDLLAGSRDHERPAAIAVLNKSDIGKAPFTHGSLGFSDAVEISAKERRGLENLVGAIHRAVKTAGTAAGSEESAVAANSRQLDALRRAREAVQEARALAADSAKAGEELVAVPLREALTCLGEIIGETSTEELLGAIFSQFCIGK